MKKHLAKLIPNFLKPTLKKTYYFSIDIIDRLKGRDSMIPPKRMIFVGDGDFEQIGQDFKDYFIELANLQPKNRVLDVGCGIGRMAIPLTNYLSKEGEYWGFDIVKEGINWCQSRISSKFQNFHFQHCDIYNKCYNPNGKVRAQDFQFPFKDDSFDFVFLTSVFTHMLPKDLENYLSEISRVLKQGGRCFITFFLLNEESTNLIHAGRSTLDFKYKIEGCLTVDDKNPEFAIAYNEDFIKGLFGNCKLKIIQPIHYGWWCKRDTFLSSYQDIIVAAKEKLDRIPDPNFLHTGDDPEVDKITGRINEHLEKHGGFEDTHWIRVVKGVAQDEKKKSLEQVLSVCIPIVVVVKIVEHVLPNILHAVGGMLDDLFGAIIPDVSQSMGDSDLPFSERFKKAWPVLKGGLVTLPLAFGLGWFSAKLYGMSASVAVHMLAGALFAIACFAGTLGTSIAAFRKSYAVIGKLQEDKKLWRLVGDLTVSQKAKLAFRESIMDVPFRVGHTVIGIPFQLTFGIAAGAFGFFHSSIFIMVEGMAETLLGSVTAFVYSYIARLKRNSRLRNTTF